MFALIALLAIIESRRFDRWFHASIGHPEHEYMDPQGALLLMAPYQLALFAALWIAWGKSVPKNRALVSLMGLLASQPTLLILLGEWVAHTGLEPHVAAIRAWSVLSVLVAGGWAAQLLQGARRRRTLASAEASHG